MTTTARVDVRERARLDELAAYRILDTEPEAAFDAIAQAAALVAGVPVAAVGLIDDRREWFKAAVGMDPAAIDRESSLCEAVVQAGQPLVVTDAVLDARFADYPLVVDGSLRFWAGFPLITPTGAVLGTLCLNDAIPRTLGPDQMLVLSTLADQVMAQLELRRQAREAYAARDEAQNRQILLDAVLDSVDVGVLVCDVGGEVVVGNSFGRDLLGLPGPDVDQVSPLQRLASLSMTDVDGHLLAGPDRPLERVVREGRFDDMEVVVRRPTDGAQRLLRVLGRMLRTTTGAMLGAMCAAHDMTAIRDREAELSARVEEVERLAASREIHRGRDSSRVACETVRELCAAQQASVMLPDEAGNLVVAATTEPAMADLVVPLAAAPLVGTAYRTGTSILVDPHDDNRTFGRAMHRIESRHGRIGCALHQPLLNESGCNGVLLLTTSRGPDAIADRTLRLLDVVTAELSAALERDRLRSQLADQARTDPLTGLANRRTWDEQVAAQTAAAGQTPLCLAILDLDHFKAYNDGHGHQAGDALLQAAGAAWRTRIRTNDTLARLGGEEFGVLLPGCALADAQTVLHGLRSVMPAGQTVSIGLAQLRTGESIESWYARADRALYRAKAEGRDRVGVDPEPFVDRRGRQA